MNCNTNMTFSNYYFEKQNLIICKKIENNSYQTQNEITINHIQQIQNQ